jgi:hypothetical protein
MSDDYGGWTFMKADSNIGDWKPATSPFTLEEYIITVHGIWVPTVDVKWLLSFEKECPCNPKKRVRMFALVTPTVDQLQKRPARLPELREVEGPNFGLRKV